MTKMLLVGFMHIFDLKLVYGGQKMGIMTVFWPKIIFTWDSLVMSIGYFRITQYLVLYSYTYCIATFFI